MLQDVRQARTSPGYSVVLAQTEDDVLTAQRLRYEVFAEELSARLPSAALGIDEDGFDPFCDHLLVRNNDQRVIGTYRILNPEGARRAGSYYCETEFDMDHLLGRTGEVVEIGRACVHPDFRNGAVISQLWSGLLRYVIGGGFRYVIGCASIAAHDGREGAKAICRRVLTARPGPDEWTVTPKVPFPIAGTFDDSAAEIPSLVLAYLRLGAVVCGPPAWDPDFQTADLLMLLDVEKINARYLDRLLRCA